MYGLAGLLAVLAIIGGFLYYRNMQTQGEIETTKKAIDEKTADLVKKTGQMTPKDIAQSYTDAVVLMNITWRLYHKSSGKPVFHKFVRINNEPMPAYVQLARDRIVRWLVTDDGEGLNRPIVAFMQGSGIVVDASGFILTNKHLAAGWFTAYSADYESNCNECGRLFIKGARDSQGGKAFTPQGDSLADRVPGDDGYLFEKKKAEVAPDGTDGPFEGRNEALEVAFPGQRANVQARFIRAMDEVDLALVKIDVPFKLKIWANLADVNDTPALGEKITVLGYPDVSERTLIEIISREAGREKDRTEVIPEPTLTEGVIANIGRGVRFSQERGSFYRTYGSMGDVYQLSATAGRGNSGGPVFNSAGKVIAIYTYAKRTDAGERFTFGVPIKYGHELLNLQGTWR